MCLPKQFSLSDNLYTCSWQLTGKNLGENTETEAFVNFSVSPCW